MENYVFSNGFGQAYTYYYNGEGEYVEVNNVHGVQHKTVVDSDGKEDTTYYY